jgi:hypothetical protein
MKYEITLRSGRYGTTSSLTKIFNGEGHLDNYICLMQRKGYKVDMTRIDSDVDGAGAAIQAEQEMYFENFCRQNNI